MTEVMPEWPGWAEVDPVVDGSEIVPAIVPARCSSQWSDENARAAVVEARSLSRWIDLAMSTLTTRGERIARLYFGFDGGEPTMKEIAKDVGGATSAVSSSLDNVFRWRSKFRRIASSVLSDFPDSQARSNLARLIEESALMRVDEPARAAVRRARAAVRSATMERAKISESMRLRFGIAVYGKSVSTFPRGDAIAYPAYPDQRNKRWRWNPHTIYLSRWPEASLSSPAATSCVVMAHAPDGISTLRFQRAVRLTA